MLTTCPECRTTFRLAHAQLEARRGMVRCGFCRAVFNAYDTLLPEFQGDRKVDSEPPPPPPAIPTPEPSKPVAPEPVPDFADPAGESRAFDEDDAFVLSLSERVNEDLPKFEPPPMMPFPLPPSVLDQRDAILLSDLPTRAEIEPRGHPLRTALFLLLNLVLLVALLGQTAYFLRGPLVAWRPDLRPVLESACRPIGCRIPMLADLAAIRLEAASLETDPEQASRASLRVSFSNRSESTQQWPHFFLRLTDWKGASLAQRALPPSNYLADAKTEMAGMAPRSDKEFRLDLDLGGLSASGYEVLPVYP